ncbi:MAG: hypothetical protein ACOCRO_07315, partial [Halanaerobiales bacterium]
MINIKFTDKKLFKERVIKLTFEELEEIEKKVDKGRELREKIEFINSRLNLLNRVLESDIDQLNLTIGSKNNNEFFHLDCSLSAREILNDIINNISTDILTSLRKAFIEELSLTKKEMLNL